MKVLLAKFCDYACHVDGGKGTLIGMFDTIGGKEYPLTHPTFYVCIELEFEPIEAGRPAELRLVLIDEDGKELMGVQGKFPVPRSTGPKPATMFQTFRVDRLKFPRPGHYRLDILYNGEPVGEAKLYLVHGPPPKAQPGSEPPKT